MQSAWSLWLYFSVFVVRWRCIDAISACDEVDVVFVIDAASMEHNGANIVRLMDSVVVNASSEFAGFSAVIYGDDLPRSLDPVLYRIDATKHIAHRRETQRVVHEAMERSLESIEAAVLQLDEPHASRLTARLRNLRDPHMPPVDPDSCDPSMPSE